jgi:2-oxo-3-hexenedioate decarboxylase
LSTTASAVTALARELMDAHETGRGVEVPPSAREGHFTLAAAYEVEAEIARLRRASGRTTTGRKVGYANKAVWRALKLQTLVWASMYDDTVHYAEDGRASLSLAHRHSPRIEPEIIFKLRSVPPTADAADVLASVEWLALGFEIVDAPFPDWQFQPQDFIAALGLHAALVVGGPRRVEGEDLALLTEQLATMRVRLSKNGELAEEGAGRNALRSPALCLGELVSAIAAQPGAEPLRPGELVSTGSLTAALPIAAGERWTVEAEGIQLAAVEVSLIQ